MTDETNGPRLRSVEDTLSWIVSSHGYERQAIYRGQTSAWPLVPSLFRIERKVLGRFPGSLHEAERSVLDLFAARAHPFLDSTPQSDFDWMVLAQHHGCPTRLLDWTGNPLVTLFFATEKHDQKDATIWSIFDSCWFIYDLPDDPLKLDRTFIYFPKHISPRIPAQAGAFTVHPFLTKTDTDEPIPLEEELTLTLPPITYFYHHRDLNFGSLIKATIPAECKRHIQRQLERLGVHRASLFPGLDGISDYIKRMLASELE
jgi:type I restriction enzyme M protein